MELLHKNTTRRLNKSLFRLGLLQLLFFAIFLGLTSTPVWSCQGQDRVEALQLFYEVLINSYNMGLTGNHKKYMPIIQDISNRINALSPSCRELVQQLSDQFGDAYNPNTTTCRGDVCCNGQGCN